jgi:hypothetical protein
MKYKRITKSVLTSELYNITYRFDISISIKTIIECIIKIKLLLIVYTDLKSFYEYFVKLRII